MKNLVAAAGVTTLSGLRVPACASSSPISLLSGYLWPILGRFPSLRRFPAVFRPFLADFFLLPAHFYFSTIDFLFVVVIFLFLPLLQPSETTRFFLKHLRLQSGALVLEQAYFLAATRHTAQLTAPGGRSNAGFSPPGAASSPPGAGFSPLADDEAAAKGKSIPGGKEREAPPALRRYEM